MSALVFIFIAIAAVLAVLGISAYRNHAEISRLRRNGYRRVAMRRYRRGHACSEMLRGIAELGIIVLLLAVVLGWMFYNSH
jgi:Tfp pilus assembly protein FimT